MTLKYHQPIFDLLRVEPVIDTSRLDEITAIEKEYEISLPEAVLEYFSIANMLEMLFEFGVFSDVNPLYLFGKSESFDGLDKHHLELMKERKVIPLFSEHQGEWTWFLNLKYESNDPKVLLHTKDFPNMLISHPHKFTKQLYLSVWDALVMQPQLSGFYMKAEHEPTTPKTLQILRRVMREIPTTYIMVANETTSRFETDRTYIAIVEDGMTSKWYFYAKSLTDLENLLKLAQKIKNLVPNLEASVWGVKDSKLNKKKSVIERVLKDYR